MKECGLEGWVVVKDGESEREEERCDESDTEKGREVDSKDQEKDAYEGADTGPLGLKVRDESAGIRG